MHCLYHPRLAGATSLPTGVAGARLCKTLWMRRQDSRSSGASHSAPPPPARVLSPALAAEMPPIWISVTVLMHAFDGRLCRAVCSAASIIVRPAPSLQNISPPNSFHDAPSPERSASRR